MKPDSQARPSMPCSDFMFFGGTSLRVRIVLSDMEEFIAVEKDAAIGGHAVGLDKALGELLLRWAGWTPKSQFVGNLNGIRLCPDSFGKMIRQS